MKNVELFLILKTEPPCPSEQKILDYIFHFEVQGSLKMALNHLAIQSILLEIM